MKKNEKPLEYFLRMLLEEKINFEELLSIYVGFLEERRKENRSDITDGAFLLSMWHKPSLNRGSKRKLVADTKKWIDKSGVFPKI